MRTRLTLGLATRSASIRAHSSVCVDTVSKSANATYKLVSHGVEAKEEGSSSRGEEIAKMEESL